MCIKFDKIVKIQKNKKQNRWIKLFKLNIRVDSKILVLIPRFLFYIELSK